MPANPQKVIPVSRFQGGIRFDAIANTSALFQPFPVPSSTYDPVIEGQNLGGC
jgi:hypothetical protein